jgi:hypothetical protein
MPEVGTVRREPERSQIVRTSLSRAHEHDAHGLPARKLLGRSCI